MQEQGPNRFGAGPNDVLTISDTIRQARGNDFITGLLGGRSTPAMATTSFRRGHTLGFVMRMGDPDGSVGGSEFLVTGTLYTDLSVRFADPALGHLPFAMRTGRSISDRIRFRRSADSRCVRPLRRGDPRRRDTPAIG